MVNLFSNIFYFGITCHNIFFCHIHYTNFMYIIYILYTLYTFRIYSIYHMHLIPYFDLMQTMEDPMTITYVFATYKDRFFFSLM